MAEDQVREITIGESTHRITRFRGLKASIAGALVARVMREVPELQDRVTEFRKKFRENNTIVITPAMAKLPRFAPLGLTEGDFRSGGGKVEFPEEAEPQTILVHVFPDLFDLADKELRKFLAVLVIPNRELEAADDADGVDEALARWGKRLMREGDVDELLELVVVGMEVFREQLMSKRNSLGKLNLPILQNLLKEREEPGETPKAEENGHGEIPPESTEEVEIPTSASPSSVPASSIDSLSDSDGTEEQLSIESLGQN